MEKRIRLSERLLALDAATARHKDKDGYLHVDISNLTRDQVAGYYGYEIPTDKKLDPHKIYYGWRCPDELQKALSTFNGVPLLFEHKFDGADHPLKETRVGAVGTTAYFDGVFVTNSLTVWDKAAIEAIEDGSLRDLSCGYWYQPDFTPGKTPDGTAYDFVMRDIKCNHVALVRVGRATDCFVADSMPDGGTSMADKNGKPGDDFKALARSVIEKSGVSLTTENLEKLVMAFDSALGEIKPGAKDSDPDCDKKGEDEEPEEKKKGGEDEDPEKLDEKKDKKAEGAEDEESKDGEESDDKDKKGAVDADEIIRVATEKATKRIAAMYEAAEEVKPLCGALKVMAFDSAPAIYEHALKKLGVTDVKGEAAAPTFCAIMKQRKAPAGAMDSNPDASNPIYKRLANFLE